MRKWIVAVVVLLLVAGAGWYFGSPWWTLYQVKEAVERKDVDALIGYIDFDALRADLKAQTHAQARKEAAADHSPIDPQVEALADQSVDSMVNPSATRTFLRDELGVEAKASGAAPAGGGDGGAAKSDDEGGSFRQLGKDIAVDRVGFDTFTVQARDKPDGFVLTFARHGLGWKLAGLRMPENAF